MAKKRPSRPSKRIAPRRVAEPIIIPPERKEEAKAEAQKITSSAFRSSSEDRQHFWDNFMRAVEAEPVEKRPVKGASGLSHPTTALGIDRNRKRIIIVSSDPDGRSAALVQADVQAANPHFKIVVARPLSINLQRLAKAISLLSGREEILQKDFTNIVSVTTESDGQGKLTPVAQLRLEYLMENGLLPAIQALSYATINIPATIQDALVQLSHVQFVRLPNTVQAVDTDHGTPLIRFGSLLALDPAQTDREMGICSIPLYDFTSDEAEVIYSGKDPQLTRQIFSEHNILQYFFPPPDMLALGLIDKKKLTPQQIRSALERSPEIGHPLGRNEIIPSSKVEELVENLKDKGYAVEGEYDLELTEAGVSARATVKFKPREGVIEKLARIISLKVEVNLKDLFGSGNNP